MATADEVLSLFPGGTALGDDGTLVVGGCRLDDLAAEYGTPVMVVASGAVRQRARDYRDLLAARWPDSRVVFASKAFPCTAVLRLLVEEGLWIDVAGGGEIVTALAAGADPATLVLHGNAKTTEEIELAVRSGIGLVVVDNVDDIDRLEAAVPAGRVQDCLVRVIPGIAASTVAATRPATRARSSACRRPPRSRRSPGSRPATGCGCWVYTRTSGPRSSTRPSWPARSHRSPRWASSRCTTWAAAWAPGTRTPTIHRRSTGTWTR